MKKLILLLLFILLIPFTLAKCCETINNKEGGCYPGRPICCIQGDKNVGYIGCKFDLGNKCPGEYLGPCLQCSSNCKPDGTDCNWVEIDKCAGLSCEITYLSDKKTPSKVSSCTNKCGEGEVMVDTKCEKEPTNAKCTASGCSSGKQCCKKGESYPAPDGTPGAVCSSDYDKDGICNVHDNSPNAPNSGTLGTCLPLTIKQTCTKTIPCPQGGHCSNNQEDFDRDGIGDASDIEERCESAYSDRQCCDLLGAKSAKDATFYGFTEDCPQNLGGVGCWSKCAIMVGEEEINFDISPCIDGQRTVTSIQNGKPIGTPTKEPCSGIPLIPFFTSFNLIFTLLILTLFYYFRER